MECTWVDIQKLLDSIFDVWMFDGYTREYIHTDLVNYLKFEKDDHTITINLDSWECHCTTYWGECDYMSYEELKRVVKTIDILQKARWGKEKENA